MVADGFKHLRLEIGASSSLVDTSRPSQEFIGELTEVGQDAKADPADCRVRY